MIYLSKNIRTLRKRLSWSQEKLAVELGLNRGNIASYENGSAEPRLCNLLKISALFEISILDLIHTDMQEADNYSKASNQFKHLVELKKNIVQKHIYQIEELERVAKSVKDCHLYRKKQMNGTAQSMQSFMHDFEQLFDINQNLLKGYKELINTIHYKPCCEDTNNMDK